MKFGKYFIIEKENICSKLKNNLLHHDFIAEITKREAQRFLEEVKIGEIVYCTIEMSDVIFIRKPIGHFDWCQYKTFDGKVKEARALCFRKISVGNKYANYKTTTLDDLKASEILAREYGFRVEKVTSRKPFCLKIYGDTKEEVDHFVTCLENNYFIY
ncbi:MAG: hypothetical protein ACFFBF_15185 [Promethearchaeota archaeon]